MDFTTQSAPATPAVRPYLAGLMFGQNLVNIVAGSISVTLFSYLLYCVFFNKSRLKVASLSKSLLVYVFTHCVLGTIVLMCCIYLVWRPENFWLRTMLLGYVSTAPVPVFFITLERCMTIKNVYRARKTTLVLSIILIVLIICGNTALNYAMIFTELGKPGNCTIFLCFILQNQLLPNVVEKAVFATINLVFGLYFFYLIRKEQALNIRNFVVKATLIMEIFFVVVPSYSSALYTLIVGEPSTSLLGTYVTMFCMIDVCGCSIIYSLAFLRKKKRSHVASAVSLHVTIRTAVDTLQT